MATPLVVGVGVAATAMSARAALLAFEAWKTAPPTLRRLYDGGGAAADCSRHVNTHSYVRFSS